MQASNRRFAAALSESQFAPAGAKKVKFVFSGGVYVGKNSARPANVRAQRSAPAGAIQASNRT
jgi:hypothetical protein